MLKELIENLKNEKFEYEHGQLHVSKPNIQITMEPDSLNEGTFLVQSVNGARIHTNVYTSHWRMKCAQREYRGPLAEIGYSFDSTGMTVGDTIRGEISVVSDAGEYTVPFVVTIERTVVTTSEGKLRNLTDFLTLANLHLELAYQAFSHPAFVQTLKNDDPKYLRWYEGLLGEQITYETMLEFLKFVGFQIPEEEVPSLRQELRQVYNRQHVDHGRKVRREQIAELSKQYLRFRGGHMEAKEFVADARTLVEALGTDQETADLYYMMGVHLSILEGDLPKAKEQLDAYVDSHYDIQKNMELYGYYLYLCAMLRRSGPFLAQACQRIRVLSVRKPKSVMLLWILLMMDEELLEDPQTKLLLMEKRHEMGVRSPFIYLEAAMLYRQDPEWIQDLSAYEVQVLQCARRYQVLSLDMVHRMAEICIKNKEFSQPLYRLLTECYSDFQDNLLLQAICGLLIKENKIGEPYFAWYERGVKVDLRITRLYDYYLYSVREDMNHPLDKELLGYFRYNQEIDYRKKAFLFANLYKFRGEYPQLYQQYKDEMVTFTVNQLALGRTNCYLILLYKNLVDRHFVTEETATYVADYIFSYWLHDLPEDVVSVAVRELAYKEERMIPVIDREAVVPVYSTDACVYLQTRDGQRRGVSDIYQQERWFTKEELLELCQQYVPDHPGILLGRAEQLVKAPGEHWKQEAWNLTRVPVLSEQFCQEIWQQLMQHFYDEYQVEDALWCLEQISLEKLPVALQTYDVEFLISQGRYQQAADYVYQYGCERLDTKRLVRLCSRLIAAKEFAKDEKLVTFCQYVFLQDKYDEVMLTYLLKYAESDTKKMIHLWRAGRRFGLDTYEVEERILKQALRTGYLKTSVYDVFEQYYKSAGNEDLLMAFLSYLSKEIMMRGLKADERVYLWLGKMLLSGTELNDTCCLAWLAGASAQASLQEAEKELAQTLLAEYMGRGLYFPFYGALCSLLGMQTVLQDKIFVECKGSPDSKMYYCSGDTMEEMESPYPGMFVKECVAYVDQSIPYWVLEQRKNDAALVTVGKIETGAPEGIGRYGKCNCVLGASEEEQEQLMDAYLKEQYVVQRIFSEHIL